MKDKWINGIAGFIIGTTVIKTIQEIRQRRLNKDMYEVVEDENTNKE